MQTNFNKLYGSFPLIGLNYMQKLMIYLRAQNNCQVSNYPKYYEAFSVSNQISISAVALSFVMNMKNKTKNTSVHMKKRSVSLSQTRIARIRIYSNTNKTKINTQTLQVKHIRCDRIKI